MSETRLRTLDGGEASLSAETVEALGAEMRGCLLRPGEVGYDDSRRIWNAMIDRRPALIARCRGTADVAAAVRLAREHHLLVAVRGGGHNVAGNAVCDGGLMIDLSAMCAVHVAPRTRRARVQGGATWGDFDAETQAHGLATTGGLISDTGVAGLTLGGGYGWLARSHALACDNLISCDVVTAAGEIVIASADENADLFWGLKGGGGNFGVVTSFEFQLHRVGPDLFGGMVLHALDDAREVLPAFVDVMAAAEDTLGGLVAFTSTPAGDPVLALVAAYNGPLSAGEAAVAPIRELGRPLLDTFAPIPYRRLQTLFDAGAPPGLRYYWKSSFLDRLPGEAMGVAIAAVRRRPSPQCKVFLEFFGGALARLPAESAVFDHRASPYNLLVIGAGERPEADAAVRAWTRETWQSMDPFASDRVYVNYLGTEADEGGDRIAEAYGPGKFDKLVALKRKYDPDNLFRMNQNIPPS